MIIVVGLEYASLLGIFVMLVAFCPCSSSRAVLILRGGGLIVWLWVAFFMINFVRIVRVIITRREANFVFHVYFFLILYDLSFCIG